jgi:glycosyltransferase involved in cell wall biosynthesis
VDLAFDSTPVVSRRKPDERPLRIAQVAPLYESVPPQMYGGTERVVAYLTDALVDLGHDVTLFASADSTTRAHLRAAREQALRLDPSPLKSDLASHFAMLHEVRRRADEFDVLHFHTDILHLPLFEDYAARTLTTLHGRLDLPDVMGVFERWPQYPLVSISDDQRRPMPSANWVATVYHGVPPEGFPEPTSQPDDYLVFLGRIAREKRPDRAIRIAQRAGRPLKIAAKVDASDTAYFEQEIKPLLGSADVEFLGELGEGDKRALLGKAAALLFPIDWPEPFGLVMIESLACGTPVIAWRHGSVPEVIDDGVTGFVIDSEDAAIAACERLRDIDRARVRHVFDARFTAAHMAANYLEVYTRIATPRTWQPG